MDLFWQLQLAAAEVEAVGGRSGGGEDVGMKAIDDEAALLFSFDEFFAFQDLQVVRDVGDIGPQVGGDLADVFGSGAEGLYDPQAIGVGQGLEPIGAFLGRQRIVHGQRLSMSHSGSRVTILKP